MGIIDIEDKNDPRLNIYHSISDRHLKSNHDLFICEGFQVVARLFASKYEIHSVLTTRKKLGDIASIMPADLPCYVIPDELLHQLLGAGYKSGYYAAGKRQCYPALAEIIPSPVPKRLVFLVLPDLNTPRNVGSIVRIGAALGITGLILGAHCSDPFYRYAIRASMGAVFCLPITRSPNLVADLEWLKQQLSIRIVGAVLDNQATPLHLARANNEHRHIAVLMGNEATGLEQELVALCDEQVTLPLHNDIDSLNVSMAAALFLYEFMRPDG